MTFNLWTFLFEILNFLVLAFVLHWLLYRPLRAAIERRQKADAEARAEAERVRLEAADMHRQRQEQRAEQEKERQQLLYQAHEQAEAERKRIIGDAETAARRRQEEARQTLDRERAETVQALQGELTQLALDLARRLLGEATDRTLHSQLALKLVETLRSLTTEEQKRVRGHWRPQDGVVLETAGDVDGVVSQITDILCAILGQPVTPEMRACPELLGGVRLRLGGFVWDASLAGPLAPKPAAAGEGESAWQG